ncbi:MAG: response regulator [Moraxellaceae bacterium]|nr:response regulator [Pseudobdellovibrionaceae bacterium]
MTKKFSTSAMIQKIEKLTKQRMAGQDVVELDQFRDVKNKMNPINILVIEDDETQRSSLKRILESDGYNPKLAADAAELTQILDEDHEIHFIILDVGLPWINGFELAQMIKDHRDLKSIPLIFLSAQAESKDFDEARQVGADDYIKKPFDIDKLKTRIRELLNRPK